MYVLIILYLYSFLVPLGPKHSKNTYKWVWIIQKSLQQNEILAKIF